MIPMPQGDLCSNAIDEVNKFMTHISALSDAGKVKLS